MRKGLFYITILIAILVGCKKDDNNNVDEGKDTGKSTNIEKFSEKFLSDVNFARTNPSGYAAEVLKPYYDKGQDNGAYNDLKSRNSVGALVGNKTLEAIADKYAKFLAENNKMGHNENGSPAERAVAGGYNYWSGENLAAGYTSGNAATDIKNANTNPEKSAREFVAQLIIDEGVASLGHRKNIMSSTHKVMAVGFYRSESSSYRNYVVQEFGYK
ncbi:MAG: CAP domain-containing protein [Bacteroidales bacterium]|jgi:hypothetical protein|nr:CAP domain-containing protein [Bacteroidales bacterium]